MKCIAIDGPAGAGKSSICKHVAAALGFLYLETGAFYRALAVYALDDKLDLTNPLMITNAVNSGKLSLEAVFVDDVQHMIVSGYDVTSRLRDSEVEKMATKLAQISSVRAYLLTLQRQFAADHNVVMEGRDTGTAIMPNADVKIFLTASAEERAKRRHADLVKKNPNITFEEVLADINKRDEIDSTRKLSPLKKADDAIEFDSSGFTFEQAAEMVYDIVKKKLEESEN